MIDNVAVNRRMFLGAGLSWLAASGLVRGAADAWRTFEVTTHVELPSSTDLIRVWLPLAHAGVPAYQRVIKQSWKPHSAGPVLPFLMYPQAEVGGRRLDSLDPQTFRYRITARAVAGD